MTEEILSEIAATILLFIFMTIEMGGRKNDDTRTIDDQTPTEPTKNVT